MVALQRPWYASCFVALALTARAASAQIEGPLDNDSYLPIASAAEAELARGDQAFAQASKLAAAGDSAAVASAWTNTCEAWRNALLRSKVGESSNPRPIVKPGEVSPWPSSEGALERSTEGVEEAVFRRLSALPKPAQIVWRERFSPLAQEQLLRAGSDATALARIERETPATAAASRAALLLSELAYERGDSAAARSWLARARRHIATLSLDEPATLNGISLREARLAVDPVATQADWRRASSLQRVAGHDLEVPRSQATRTRALGAGPQAGLAFLDGDRALLQTTSQLWVLSGKQALLSGPFGNNDWLLPAGLQVEPTVAPGDGPGWRLDPSARGSSAVVVVGRSLGDRSNVLACLDFDVESRPRLRWAQAAAAVPPERAQEERNDEYEFQPGPLWLDGLVVVMVRHTGSTSGEHEIELRGLEPATGELRWRTYLGKGGERVRDLGRFARRGLASQPAQPLLVTQEGVFASAQLGFSSMTDPLDGRALFAIRNHRRSALERGWTGWGATLAQNGVIGWAPADSAYLYVLEAGGAKERGTPLASAPRALGEAEALVHADQIEVLVLGRSGARGALSRWDLVSGARQDAIRLGPAEVFSGRAIASDQRVIAASDRALYLFDRGSDLALLDAPMLGGPIPRGGNVWAKGSKVFVLSNRCVEIFEAR